MNASEKNELPKDIVDEVRISVVESKIVPVFIVCFAEFSELTNNTLLFEKLDSFCLLFETIF